LEHAWVLRKGAAVTWPFAHLWDGALTFERFVQETSAYGGLWAGVRRTARVPDELVARTAALGRRFRLLAIVEDWCGDASNSVPVLARWAELVPNVELRLVRRDQQPDLMDAYLSGTSRSIPIVVVLTEAMGELGHWGPRPGVLQAWVMAKRRAGAGKEIYPDIRKWYAQDKGESTLKEILAIMAGSEATEA
jgi:hypothetical protein